VDPNWDYEKSPIFFIKNSGEMSWKNKEQSIRGNTKIVEKIISHHQDENGLIHTVNYEIMNFIRNNLDNKRFIYYNNSKEKEVAINRFYQTGGVLIGPSHFEGLNFTDEQSRFQIIMKVPYLTLGDNFIMEKSKLNPLWYNWKTYVTLIQGIGRSIRHHDDYATTYIVDGSFNKFIDLNQSFFSQNIKDRLQIV
jgi:Rad3-related DNA helicase